ncbi:4-hydroxythreonine-4-phosphate dehydrogenase PdxA [Testudinibacter aquarius]|uniref:4-hydroxythreonine-4-phosphate dehydrogenase n=1 Tax=Testudinibacter aquarius TaxID=1524974 RepID=A0A4R3YCZ9_9PAST|nr:4-hydroxythreonine-4-phosphate dehydrogenase PdxA [Testudinibacter aquarius]KAE9529365.1 4-hydroxythreonine-4-phosphate dehydrogenase [Testudinibacter aquarius]TCV89890.1 4-hydroxythreonine-4-phosphate dehydrogenase [Testudinibacter aquarius]TNG93737.1 4-hydroxythreonine-4-phosphate dehydrogenase PdxA [Testudinibacter aquarius]
MIKPTLALVLGDPAGVGPELVAKLLNQHEYRNKANILIIADKDELHKGMDIAQVQFEYDEITEDKLSNYTFKPSIPALITHKCSHPLPFEYGKATEQSGVYILETLKKAVDFAQAGYVHSICFAPLNKQAMHKGGLQYRDELHWFADQTNFDDFVCELNVVDDIWAGRVTSHIPFKDIVPNLSIQSVVDCVRLLHKALVQAGIENPKIAVQALNPHGGEGGVFGDEEIKIITPGIEKAREFGIDVYGPFPGDTTMHEVERLKIDGVVSMYHDQFSTALKLLGFERGVTVQGGIPIPITTANHGTAFDLYGKNIAIPTAFEAAFNIAVRMGTGVLKSK